MSRDERIILFAVLFRKTPPKLGIGFDGVSGCVAEFQREPRKGGRPITTDSSLIGFELTSVAYGQAVMEFQAGEQAGP